MTLKFRPFSTTITVLLSLLYSSDVAKAYEVDNFTGRNQVPADSTSIIDQEIQSRLQKAVNARSN